MKRTNATRALSAMALATILTATPALASTPDTDSANNQAEIQVVNNHQDQVAVYALGENNQRVYLGSVNRTRFKSFTVPAGSVKIQILPRAEPAGLGARHSQDRGIQTRSVDLQAGQAVQVWLEPGLTGSTANLRGD